MTPFLDADIGDELADVLIKRARVLLESGRTEKAIEDLKRAIDHHPDPETIAELAKVFRAEDRGEDLRKLLERFASLKHPSLEPYRRRK